MKQNKTKQNKTKQNFNKIPEKTSKEKKNQNVNTRKTVEKPTDKLKFQNTQT